MKDTFIIFSLSAWWLGPSVLIILGLTYLMYAKKNPWSIALSKFLGSLRVLATLLLVLMLLNPLINRLNYITEKPIVALAIDNSTSLLSNNDSTALNDLIENLQDNLAQLNLETFLFDLKGTAQLPIVFEGQATNLNAQLDVVYEALESSNLSAIVLMSDGIYNQGLSPAYRKSIIPIYTLGLGDTLIKKDISITEIRANKVVYQGNRFPIEAYIDGSAYTGTKTVVRLLDGQEMISEQEVTLSAQLKVQFEAIADTDGLKRLRIEIPPEENEFSKTNNYKDIFIEVVEGKEKILIVAPAPHPDIRTLRSSLSQSKNYETELYIPRLNQTPPSGKYDVVIQHQAFTDNFPELTYNGTPAFLYILNETSDHKALRDETGIIIEQLEHQQNLITPTLNTSFSKFTLLNQSALMFQKYPTLNVPFGDYQLSNSTETLLYQQVGNLVLAKPLLSFFDDGSKKYGILFGNGIWTWRMQEMALSDAAKSFDEILLKSIQYLSIRSDKRKFTFTPITQSFQTGDLIRFASASYDALYDQIKDNKIVLTLFQENSQSSNFDFIGNNSNETFNIGTLPEGIYQYEATTEINSKTEVAKGTFTVANAKLELTTFTANHNVLKELSENSGGQFYLPNNIDQLTSHFEQSKVKSIIHPIQDFTRMIDMTWILALIIGLYCLEWFLRKYLGSY
ncbi:MAG: hypothetical protein HQ474_03740 [Flammeovirgaceae bacterium]|jgi:hypothetical protein|nr:hypothetical protein [Flammeovirgaceae bacterium]|tara:strand:- start:34979 stop:37018 length:2040 start_codon:yes stop_codon:yes gene_type:complete